MRFVQKITVAFLILFCLHGAALAQVLPIRGIVFKKNSSERISQALVTDVNSQVVMMSDELGGFTIKASAGDTLLITKNEYMAQKLTVLNGNDQVIYLQPVVQLNEVTIKGQTKKQELNEVMQQYHSQGIFNDGKSLPFWEFVNSPITAFYNLFGKSPGQARRCAEYSKNELEATEVDRRYTKELVKSVTKLPDEEVPKFMQAFTPSYEDVKQWNDYQLIQYIKKSFAYYQKNKDRPETKLQKLY